MRIIGIFLTTSILLTAAGPLTPIPGISPPTLLDDNVASAPSLVVYLCCCRKGPPHNILYCFARGHLMSVCMYVCMAISEHHALQMRIDEHATIRHLPFAFAIISARAFQDSPNSHRPMRQTWVNAEREATSRLAPSVPISHP